MSRGRPEPGCYEVAFQAGHVVGEAGEVALEDYARVLTRSRGAEAVRAADPPRVTGVHLCGVGASPPETVLTDIEDFARDLAARGGADGSGLGWN